MTPVDVAGYRRQAQASIDLRIALTTIPPEHLLALCSSWQEQRERIEAQSRAIAEQAAELERLRADERAAQAVLDDIERGKS